MRIKTFILKDRNKIHLSHITVSTTVFCWKWAFPWFVISDSSVYVLAWLRLHTDFLWIRAWEGHTHPSLFTPGTLGPLISHTEPHQPADQDQMGFVEDSQCLLHSVSVGVVWMLKQSSVNFRWLKDAVFFPHQLTSCWVLISTQVKTLRHFCWNIGFF